MANANSLDVPVPIDNELRNDTDNWTSIRLPNGKNVHGVCVRGSTWDLLDELALMGHPLPYDEIGVVGLRGRIKDFEKPLVYGPDGDVWDVSTLFIYFYGGNGGGRADKENSPEVLHILTSKLIIEYFLRFYKKKFYRFLTQKM